MDLMQSLAGEMGLGYQMQLMADGKIGNRGETGEWNGLLGEIMRQVGRHYRHLGINHNPYALKYVYINQDIKEFKNIKIMINVSVSSLHSM